MKEVTSEFKAEAVRLCKVGDRSIGQVAKDLDLTDGALRWFDALDVAERTRRDTFTAAFKANHESFQNLPLSNARNVSMHRSGIAPGTVRIESLFGVVHVGSPTKRIPVAASRPLEIGRGLPWESPLPVLSHQQGFLHRRRAAV